MSSLFINVHYVPGGRGCRPGPRYWDNLKGGLRTSLRSALSHRFRNIPVKPSPEVAELHKQMKHYHTSRRGSGLQRWGHCCGPVGRRWFPESQGSPRPAALPGLWDVLSPPRTVGFSGALVSSYARWAQVLAGDRPQSVLCAAGGGAAVWRLAGSRRDQTVGHERITVRRACR